jgi:hypothetical protein
LIAAQTPSVINPRPANRQGPPKVTDPDPYAIHYDGCYTLYIDGKPV